MFLIYNASSVSSVRLGFEPDTYFKINFLRSFSWSLLERKGGGLKNLQLIPNEKRQTTIFAIVLFLKNDTMLRDITEAFISRMKINLILRRSD